MALIRKFPLDPGLNFIGRRNLFLAIAALITVGSIVATIVMGLNFGVDFRGGLLIEARMAQPTDLGELRDRLGGLGLGEVTLQQFGDPTDVLINVSNPEEESEAGQQAAVSAVTAALGAGVEIRRQEYVGPKVGDELRVDGILATVLAMLGIAIYVWLRFEWQFGVAALISLVHDVLATIGFFAVTQLEFNLTSLAAVLTIAGYSINDTVVIFDRVREMLRRYKKLELNELLNRAVNSTLSRTLLTSVSTLLALVALFVFGGEVIRGFTAGLIWGIALGTFSSFGLAVPLLSYMKLRRSDGTEKAEAGATEPSA